MSNPSEGQKTFSNSAVCEWCGVGVGVCVYVVCMHVRVCVVCVHVHVWCMCVYVCVRCMCDVCASMMYVCGICMCGMGSVCACVCCVCGVCRYGVVCVWYGWCVCVCVCVRVLRPGSIWPGLLDASFLYAALQLPVNSGRREDLSLRGTELGLKATSELLEFGLVVFGDEVQFAVAQGQPFFRCKQVIATTILLATYGSSWGARFRFLPSTLQLMILGDKVQFAVAQGQSLLICRAYSSHVNWACFWGTIGSRSLTPEWAKLGNEVQLTVA